MMRPLSRRTVLRSLFLLFGLQIGACGDRQAQQPLATAKSSATPDPSATPEPSATLEPSAIPKSSATAAAPDSIQLTSQLEQRWIVTAAEAKLLIDQGATLLDAQGDGLGVTRLQGAQPVRWDQFTPSDAMNRGRLLEDDQALEQQLRALGISQAKPVVVFGNPPRGWGEEGRMVWMLRTLGHRQTVLVDGGISALQSIGMAKGKRLKADAQTGAQTGDFVVQRTDQWDIQQEELRQYIAVQSNRSSESDSVQSDSVLLIDTREPREYNGETPYGEQRGGHVPGAIHLYFKDLLNADGTLLSEPDLRQTLKALGVTPNREIVTYCTGGIRSGWLTAVLSDLGYSARNYAGSMWEWSAGEGDRYPLERE